MRDVPAVPFVCPNRECHRQFTADAHTIANLRSKVQQLEAKAPKTIFEAADAAWRRWLRRPDGGKQS